MSNASAHADTSLFRNKVYVLEKMVLFEYGNPQVIFFGFFISCHFIFQHRPGNSVFI